MTLNIAKLEVLACTLDIVVDHVDEDRAAKQTLLLQNLVDQVKLVPDRLLLLFCELRLLGTSATQAACLATLDLERREHVLEAREQTFLLLLSATHHGHAPKVPLRLVFEQVAHADVVDLAVGLVDVRDRFGDLGVASRVSFYVRADALPMEGVLAGVDEELAVVKDRTEADVAVLGRVDDDVPVLLMASLRAQQLRVLAMLLDLSSQLLDLLFVVVQTVA